jgi:hypothetical protein
MEKTFLEEVKEVIDEWDDESIPRPAIYMPVEPLEIRMARKILAIKELSKPSGRSCMYQLDDIAKELEC